MKELYDAAFTDYGGQIGYAPAVATIAICCALCGALIYGAVIAGKAITWKQASVIVQLV